MFTLLLKLLVKKKKHFISKDINACTRTPHIRAKINTFLLCFVLIEMDCVVL